VLEQLDLVAMESRVWLLDAAAMELVKAECSVRKMN
jgi:hypothetical protein